MQPIIKPKHKKMGLIKLGGVSGSVKKFDKKLFDKYDTDARNIIKNILGNDIKDNENQYGEDMVFTLKPFPYKYLEIQVMSTWECNAFPYICPFVYARKMRFSEKTLFVSFNKFLSEMVIFGRDCISNIPSRLKKYDREIIHYVPWAKCIKIKTNQFTTKLIRGYSGENVYDSESGSDKCSDKCSESGSDKCSS